MDAERGLPADVFLLVSRLTPLINVDLLIKDASGRTLLTWRYDEFYGPGWHIPGGIVRFRESFAQRIAATARAELGAYVHFYAQPLMIREITNPDRDIRGHFVSFLFRCDLDTAPDRSIRFSEREPQNGQWAWHPRCPDNLIKEHDAYRPFIDGENSPSPEGKAMQTEPR